MSCAKGVKDYPIVIKCLETFAPGYKYTFDYKRGRWNGRVNLFNSESFLTGLVPTVLKVIIDNKIPYTITDNRKIKTISLKPSQIDLRSYQEDTVNKALTNQYLGTWWPRGVIQICTGGGKSEVAAAMIQMTGVPTIFLVHRKDLQTQTIERFNKYGILAGELNNIASNLITVTTVQSLMSWSMDFSKCYINNKGDKIQRNDAWLDAKSAKQNLLAANIKAALENIEQVFIDEAHLITSKMEKIGLFSGALNLMPNAYMRWGLTATPFMKEQLHNWMLEGATGPAIVNINNRELINAGYLTECIVDMFLTGKQPDIAKTWPDCYDLGIVTNQIRNNKIIDCFNTYEGPTLILVSKISHGKLLSDKLNIPFLSGQSSQIDRKSAIDAIKDGKLSGIIASTIWDEGIDLPSIRCVILAGGGKSDIKNLQRLGRGLRKSEDKSYLRLIDFFDQSPFILKRHSEMRKSLWLEQGFKVNMIRAF